MARKRTTRLPTHGKRSGVELSASGAGSQLESIESFFDQARSPEEKKDDDPSMAKNAASLPSRRSTRAKGPERMAQEKIRLSLPGQGGAPADDASTSSEGDSKQRASASKRRSRKIMGVPSPSDLSKVSTMPPTPRVDGLDGLLTQEEPETQEDVEVPRHAANEEEVAEQPGLMNEEAEPADFPMQDDENDDDGDDLAPPMMDDDDMDQDEPEQEAQEEDEEDRKPAATTLPENSLSDTESDDDKEGSGFNMVHDPETPDTAKEVRASEEGEKAHGRKKKSKLRDSFDSDDKTPARKSKKKKGKRVAFSPKGIPIGPREYDRIPIVEPSPGDDGGPRRSRRSKTTPLEFWRNEKMEYGPADDEIADEVGDMPVPKAVVRALDTPYRKRKEPVKSKTAAKNKKAKGKKRSSRDEDDDDDDEDNETFDGTKLKRKFKDNLLAGETANVWDDGNDDLNDLSEYGVFQDAMLHIISLSHYFILLVSSVEVVSYAEQMEAAELPLSTTRTKDEGAVVGSAAQAFNVPSDANDNYVGYIMGNLLLPPRGIKDAESVGPCSQTFTVCTGQKKALEVAFADPDGPEGMLEDDSAQRFLLGPGDLFRVPPGNTYRLENHSKTRSCLLTWTIIRPRNPPDQESP
jgi:centromere protein C